MTASAAVPIRRKLSSISLITTGIALLLTMTLFLAGEIISVRRSSLQELQILNEAIASNSTAALAFDNPEDARAVLGALRSDPHFVAAALYKNDGTLFVTFPETLSADPLPLVAGPAGYAIHGSALIGITTVSEGQRSLGTLYVRTDLSALYERLAFHALLALLVIALALLAAWAVTRRLQRQLSAPLLELAATARRVSDRHDYGVRATPVGINELDDLTNAFNHMLTQTGQYEQHLSAQVSRLALLQQITHSIGSRHDLKSIFQVVLGSLEKHMPIDFGCVCLHDAAASAVSVVSVGTAGEALCQSLDVVLESSVPIGRNGLYRAMNGALIYEPNTAEVHSPFTQRFAGAGFSSLVIAPLSVESVVFGVLLAVRREKHAFTSRDCEFLKQLSEHVALASHQAQIYAALQTTYDDLRHSQQAVMQTERLRALGEMASGIAHDINNAISPVALYAELLLNTEPDLTEAGRGRLSTIRRAIEDVAGTIDRMREFYRPREARDFNKLDIASAFEQVLELTEPRWRALPQERGIVVKLNKQLAAALPDVMGDEVELRDALTNLVFNAVDAMPEGGTLTLRTAAAIRDDGQQVVHVEVSDTGIGMDEETRRRCVEPFFTTKGQRGTGLGLASVYGMLQRHHASLEVDSTLGTGTTMRMIFTAAIDQSATSGIHGVLPSALRKLRILVIDDDPILIRSVGDVLEADGHEIQTALGGQAGIDAFTAAQRGRREFALVITDLGMPHVDGRKVAAAIKAMSQSTPVLLLTGWGQRLLDEKELPPNVDRVLSKPPRLNQLRAALADLAR